MISMTLAEFFSKIAQQGETAALFKALGRLRSAPETLSRCQESQKGDWDIWT